LSLFREYLDLEFASVKPKLKFPYDLEHIIDDWVSNSLNPLKKFTHNLSEIFLVGLDGIFGWKRFHS
jgi:5'-3' exoribonuclease 1